MEQITGPGAKILINATMKTDSFSFEGPMDMYNSWPLRFTNDEQTADWKGEKHLPSQLKQ